MRPDALAAIADLRARIAALPHVVRVTGIDQQMAHMHHVLTGAPAGTLPQADTAPAQYLFLYEASAGPEDFRSQIDLGRQHALIRARLETDRFSATEPTVRALERVAADWSAETGLAADVSGRVAVNAGWMRQLADTHVRGLAIAVGLVFLVTVAIFRAVGLAVLAMVPVVVGVLFVYAAMGALGIDIAPATSMTAAIATGLGIDFAIHLLAHVRRRRAEGASLADALRGDYVLVARACAWCALALAAALATICLSSAPPLRWFGLLVAAGAIGSLVGALFLLPGLLALGEQLKTRRFAHAR
jgi:predicted RND superfamily exporter protein